MFLSAVLLSSSLIVAVGAALLTVTCRPVGMDKRSFKSAVTCFSSGCVGASMVIFCGKLNCPLPLVKETGSGMMAISGCALWAKDETERNMLNATKIFFIQKQMFN